MIETIRIWFSAHRRPALVGLFVVAAVLLGLVLAYRGTYRGRYAVPSAGADRVLSLAPPPVPTPAPRPAPIVAAAAPPAADTGDGPEEEADDEDRQDDQDRIARAIDHAVRKALRRGETVHWHKAGREGFVLVSTPREDADRTCRNVTATALDPQGETRSNVHLWCAPVDTDDWAPIP